MEGPVMVLQDVQQLDEEQGGEDQPLVSERQVRCPSQQNPQTLRKQSLWLIIAEDQTPAQVEPH